MLSDGDRVGGLPFDDVVSADERLVSIRLELIDDRLLHPDLAQVSCEEKIAAVRHMNVGCP